ncbi:MAG: (d)CMP kinase [Armatimonadota bacterium]
MRKAHKAEAARRGIAVAIDGPGGSGKSTVARRVARRLGYTYVDTGAMYRAVAYRVLKDGLDPSDKEAVAALAQGLSMRFEAGETGQRLIVDGEDVSEAIRTPEVSRLSSPVSAIAGVRRRLTALQREMGQAGGVVMEGRDIQTVVLPEAEVKVFLTASDEERARRRYRELEAKGQEVSLAEVKRMLEERDRRDSQRALAPLAKAPEAVELFTDGMTIEQEVDRIVELAVAAGAVVPARGQ